MGERALIMLGGGCCVTVSRGDGGHVPVLIQAAKGTLWLNTSHTYCDVLVDALYQTKEIPFLFCSQIDTDFCQTLFLHLKNYYGCVYLDSINVVNWINCFCYVK